MDNFEYEVFYVGDEKRPRRLISDEIVYCFEIKSFIRSGNHNQ